MKYSFADKKISCGNNEQNDYCNTADLVIKIKTEQQKHDIPCFNVLKCNCINQKENRK
jgi:hypothetical protein